MIDAILTKRVIDISKRVMNRDEIPQGLITTEYIQPLLDSADILCDMEKFLDYTKHLPAFQLREEYENLVIVFLCTEEAKSLGRKGRREMECSLAYTKLRIGWIR